MCIYLFIYVSTFYITKLWLFRRPQVVVYSNISRAYAEPSAVRKDFFPSTLSFSPMSLQA